MHITSPIVLILDDQQPVRDSLSRFLQACGYQTVTCETADEACRIASRTPIAVAILDVRLPDDRSGLEVLEFLRLHEDRASTPVTILTAHTLGTDEEDIIRRHRAYVFYKPQAYGNLVRHLDRILNVARDSSVEETGN